MGETLQKYSVLELAVMAYMVLGIIKSILCAGNVSVVAAVMHRKMGGHSYSYYFVLATVLGMVVAFVRAPLMLIHEKARFFLVYPDRKVMRDVLSGI